MIDTKNGGYAYNCQGIIENEKCLFSNTQEFYTGVLHNVLVTWFE